MKENELAARVDNCLKLVEEMNKEGHKNLAEKLKEGCELAKIDIEKEKDKVIEGALQSSIAVQHSAMRFPTRR